MTGLEEITLPDGTTRKLGNNVPPAGLTKAWPVFAKVPECPIIPRDQWPAMIAKFGEGPAHPHRPPIHDQDGVGQCNCDDTAALLEYLRNVAGLPYVQLSAADLYDRINGGRDQGSLLEDAIAEVMTRGIGTAATSGLIWGRRTVTASDEERARFKLLEAYLCYNFDECMSAVFYGFGLSTGILWYNNYTPDSQGWLPPGRGGSGGHAIFGFKPAMRAISGKVQYGIWHQQSWGKSWSPETDNCFVIPESAYGSSIGGWWAGRSIVDEGGQVPTPP